MSNTGSPYGSNVQLYDNDGTWSGSETPPVPSLAIATGTSENLIVTITIDYQTAGFYELSVSDTGAFAGEESVVIYDVLAALTPFNSGSLGVGVTKYYAAKTINGVGSSVFSNTVSDTTVSSTIAPAAATNFVVTPEAVPSWERSDTLATSCIIQIWNGSSWPTFVNLDSTPNVLTTTAMTVPGASGATPNAGGEYGFRLRLNNTNGSSYSNESWTALSDSGTVTAGVIAVAATSSSAITVSLATNPTNLTSLVLQQSLTGGQTPEGWTTIAGVTQIADFPVAVTLLATATEYFYRLEVTDGVDTVYTDSQNTTTWGATATLIFSDDFASGDTSKTVNGFAWGGSDNVVVSTDNPRTGSHSFKFTHGTGSRAEQRFYMGALRSDITQEFYLYIPDGTEAWGGITYEHYNEDGGGDNNKFMRLWDSSGYGSSEKVGSSMGTSTETGLSSNYAEWDSGTGVTWQGFDTAEQNFINAADRGTWIKIKTYHKSATVANNDGIVKFYKNDVLLYSRTTVDNYHASGDHAWSDGYLLGSASGHFPAGELMHLFIDDYKLWAGEA